MTETFNSKVIDIRELTPNVRVLKLSVPGNFEFKAGQYVSISVMVEGVKIRKPYSIASAPGKDFIELCVKNMNGDATNYIFSLKKGDKVELFGPLGIFFISDQSLEKDLVFIANGTGLAPIMSMIYDLLENKFEHNIILFFGEKYKEDLIYQEELQKLMENHPNFKLHNVLSREKDFENKGHVQDFLEKYIDFNTDQHFYLCGLSKMINEIAKLLKKKGVVEEKIFYEKYD